MILSSESKLCITLVLILALLAVLNMDTSAPVANIGAVTNSSSSSVETMKSKTKTTKKPTVSTVTSKTKSWSHFSDIDGGAGQISAQAGELLTGLGGHPSQKIPVIKETNQHSIDNLLQESLSHENQAVSLYQKLLDESQNKSLYIEEYAREMIKTEEMHSLEIKKMLRDYK